MNNPTPEQQNTTINEMMQGVFAALQPAMIAFQQVITSMATIIEDATREGAYQPTGPVLDSTARIIDETPKALLAPREEQ